MEGHGGAGARGGPGPPPDFGLLSCVLEPAPGGQQSVSVLKESWAWRTAGRPSWGRHPAPGTRHPAGLNVVSPTCTCPHALEGCVASLPSLVVTVFGALMPPRHLCSAYLRARRAPTY